MIAAIASAFFSCPALAQQPVTGDRCWTDAQLAVKPGEQRIRKHIARAYVPLPEGNVALQPVVVPEAAGRAIRRVDLPDGIKRIALTFDLCEQPHEVAGYQGGIVDFLRANNVKATFFSGGKWLLTHPHRADQLVGDPSFEIGSHGWEHRNQQVLSGTELRQEIDGADFAYQIVKRDLEARACKDRLGKSAAHTHAAKRQTLFRFPYGACSKEALEAVSTRGLLAVQWDVSSGDSWPTITARQIATSVLRRVRPGSIVLFHANGRGHKTEQAVALIVEKLRSQGYEFVTVGELLRTPGGKIVTSKTCYDSRPGDTDRYKGLARRMERVYQRFYRRHGTERGPSDRVQQVN